MGGSGTGRVLQGIISVGILDERVGSEGFLMMKGRLALETYP